MTDHTIVGNDANGSELRINDSVRITHPSASPEWLGKEAVITAKHKPSVFTSMACSVQSTSWVMLDNGVCAPAEALEKAA